MQSTYSWDCCRVVPFPTEDERQMLVGVKCVFVQRKPAKTIQLQFLWLTILQLNSIAITFFPPEIFILYIWGGEREREKKKQKTDRYCTTAVVLETSRQPTTENDNEEQRCNRKQGSENKGDETKPKEKTKKKEKKEPERHGEGRERRTTAEKWVSVSAARGWNTAERQGEAGCFGISTHHTASECRRFQPRRHLKQAFRSEKRILSQQPAR